MVQNDRVHHSAIFLDLLAVNRTEDMFSFINAELNHVSENFLLTSCTTP